MAPKRPLMVQRVCPAGCKRKDTALQREVSEDEFSRLSNMARMKVYASPGRCFICTNCQHVYIKELTGVVPVGYLKGGRWQSDEYP